MAKTKEINELSAAELEKKVRDLRTELLQFNLRRRVGQLEKPHLLQAHRRDIARCLTRLRKLAAAT